MLGKICLCFLSLFLLASCSKPVPPPVAVTPPAMTEDPGAVSWPLAKRGLRYLIEADSDLNMEDNIPLAVSLCVYQLDDLGKFAAKANSSLGIHELLNTKPDLPGVVSVKCYAAQPNSKQLFTEDRMPGAHFFGVIAGYANLRPEFCVATMPFPTHSERNGIIFKTTYYSAGKLDARIHLRSQALTLSGVERVQ